jgi:hypothetical protein
MERWILSVLAHGEETTTKGLATEYYWPEEIPLNGQTVITKTVRRLQKKTARE